MGTPSVLFNRSAFSNSSANLEFKSDQLPIGDSQLQSGNSAPTVAGQFMRKLRGLKRQRNGLGIILAGLLMILMPINALAAQVTLAWDANQPAPEGYRVFQRQQGAAYDYANPVWPTDGSHHTETTCTIANLTEGGTYFFVVRAYVGNDQSGDSNEVSFQASTPPPSTYNISASSGANGSISPSGSITVTDGADQRFDFTPNSGYQVAAVTVDGQSMGALSSYTFSNVTQNHTIAVGFAATNHTITASAGTGGSIAPAGSVSVANGGSRTFNFTPNSGYQVAAVTVDGQSMGALSSYTFSSVTQNHTIAVSFSAIENKNQPPTAEAGANKTVTEGDSVVLNGSGSSDPDGDTITYRWVQKSGPTATLSGTNSVQCTFTAPDPNATSATLVFELTVTDSKGLFSGDTCVVLVNAAQQLPDNDKDGIPDNQDSDDDNDGMPDEWEVQYSLDPFTNDAGLDPDNDGITNLEEYQAGSDPTQKDGNQPPNRPALTSPVDGETAVSLTPLLKASVFDDPDSGDQLAQSQWRIFFSGGNQQIVLDRTRTKTHLTEIRVPRHVLDPSTEYTAQVRYFDTLGNPSPWSLPATFATGADARDKNKNKIPDSQEVSADVDINGDFIPDLEQQTLVKTVSTYNDQGMMGVSTESNDTVVEVQAAASIDPTTLVSEEYSTPYPENETPYGLLGYKIKVTQPGESVRATIYLSNPVDPQQTQWIRYDDVNGMQNCSGTTEVDESGLIVDRYLVDGGDEDADGTANGVIVDLSGPRTASGTNDSSLAISTDGSASPGGSSSGCFIQSLF